LRLVNPKQDSFKVVNATNIKDLVFAGLDVGSLATKAILMSNDAIMARFIALTGANPKKAGKEALDQVLSMAGKDRTQLSYVVGTGYGRVNLPFANRTITELTCHAKGAHFSNKEIRTVIDIGGQDSKVIHVDRDGNMIDFAMNDKCAAGTGRFLEVMSKALELSLPDLGDCALQSKKPCSITNTCAVFAESEVISLLAAGQAKDDIAAGLHQAIAQRVGNLAQRMGVMPEIVFVGGVAKNAGVQKALEDFLEIKFVSSYYDPQFNGALGAAALAKEIYCNSDNMGR
jgi:predicted CoA-substrate-specific enzyme activase